MATIKCCRKNCKNRMIDPQNDAMITIRLPTRDDDTDPPTLWNGIKSLFEYNPKTFAATFHQSCWEDNILKPLNRKRTCLAKCLREASETAELFMSKTEIQGKATNVANMIRQSKHAIVFTGAGISTSAGIGDYRGLFGVWTEQDRSNINNDNTNHDSKSKTTQGDKNNNNNNHHDKNDDDDYVDNQNGEEVEVPYEELRPTLTHEAITWLVNQKMVKYVITQNCDGLHTLSGINRDDHKIAELHGCVFVEYCRECGTEYERNTYVLDDDAYEYFERLQECGKKAAKTRKRKKLEQCSQCKLTHRTGRTCKVCKHKKPLYDTIINFGDLLRSNIMNEAIEHSKRADLILAVGSSLTVTPACDLVRGGNNDNPSQPPTAQLVICNRQATDMDQYVSKETRLFGDCDLFFEYVLIGLMGQESYKQWKNDRPKRMEQYNLARK